MRLVTYISIFVAARSFSLNHIKRNIIFLSDSATSVSGDSPSWQEDVDSILNIDTDCDIRRERVTQLLGKSSAVVDDFIAAVNEKDIKKIAPSNLAYGKAIEGLKAFRQQLFSDVIPGIIFNDGPKLLQESPKLINEFVTDGPKTISGLVSKGQDLASSIRDISQDPSLLQSTLDDLRREVKNVVRSTPEGLQTPEYSVLKKTDMYEIRDYSSYSVCSTELQSDEDQSSTMSPLTTGKGFTKLADYLFGKKLSMTTPVIISSGSMEFVLPSGMTMSSAPLPEESDVLLKDVPAEVVGARSFTGLATDGEVMRQRAALEDALLADGIAYDNLSFRVLQYNPPYTLPWLRRNEVVLKLLDFAAPLRESSADISADPTDEFSSSDASQFFSAPEAGD